MRKILFFILLAVLTGQGSLRAQQFEGIVDMTQESAGMVYQVKWYIRKDRIAYELFAKSDQGSMQFRFVPQPEKNNMLLITNGTNNSDKREIPVQEIMPSPGLDIRNLQVEAAGAGAPHPEFRETQRLIVRSASQTVTELDYSTEIDVDLSKYAAYLKEDYGIQALAQSRRTGFPVSSVTKDRSGQVISRTRVTKVTRTKVQDKHFY